MMNLNRRKIRTCIQAMLWFAQKDDLPAEQRLKLIREALEDLRRLV